MNTSLDLFLFAILPYLAMAIFFVETIRRYFTQAYSYTSLSSQFLENRFHFWSLVPFHYGLLGTLIGHVLAFLVPKQLLLWNSVPVRLYILEITALMFGLMALVGVIHVTIRRMRYANLKAVTSRMDWILYGFLLLMITSGVTVALFERWGTSWFASAITPYLWSLIKFRPDISVVTMMPMAFKLHILSAFLLIAVFPFTKLVHVLVIPNQYFFRKRQVVRWNWDRKTIRHTGSVDKH